MDAIKETVRSGFRGKYLGKRVLVTGHTGFKGAWLSEWLLSLGAEVTGLALPAPTQPALFEQLGLAGRMTSITGDVRDLAAVEDAMRRTKPDFVFHLAAQPLVRYSYDAPVETYATNVMGSVHVLEALRRSPHPCAVVMVTTDKCYENREWLHAYRESDAMGGWDPYSSSKGAAELAIAAYRRSFFNRPDCEIRVASARAGNVIGGGDWAMDRIVPDCIRSLRAGQSIPIRNKTATRPWQYVLEPLSGYLWLGACLAHPELVTFPDELRAGFNFGPPPSSNRTVLELVEAVLRTWPGQWVDRSDPAAVHEAKLLNLSTEKAFHVLGWQPVWDFADTVRETVTWYRQSGLGSIGDLTRDQLGRFVAEAENKNYPWTT